MTCGQFIEVLDKIAPLGLDRIILITNCSAKDLSNSHCQFHSGPS